MVVSARYADGEMMPFLDGLMLLSGMNSSLHFVAWRSLSMRPYFGDSEVHAYPAALG